MSARRLAAALALVAGVLTGAPMLAQAPAGAADLPDGADMALVKARCVTCHGADLIVQ